MTGEGCDPTLEEEERREHAPMSEDELINLIDGVLGTTTDSHQVSLRKKKLKTIISELSVK